MSGKRNERNEAMDQAQTTPPQTAPPQTARPERQLLADVIAFINRHGLTDTQFGVMATHSTQLLWSLRRGRKCRPETEARIREFMAKGSPRGAGHASKYAGAVRRNTETQAKAAAFRRTDELERAKTFIRSRTGFCCFEAQITRPEHFGKYFIGARLVTPAELLDFARRKGWTG